MRSPLNFSSATLSIAFFILWSLSSIAASEAVQFEHPEDVSRLLKQHSVIKGNFIQSKRLVGIPRDIKSNGTFLYWKKQAMHWRTLKPFFQASTFTPTETISWTDAGSAEESTSNKSTVQKEISKILLVIMGGDFKKASQLFAARWHFDNNTWSVELTPKLSLVGNVINNIKIQGSSAVEHLDITAANGDKSSITFSTIQLGDKLSQMDCESMFGEKRFYDDSTNTCLKK